jgi:replication factor C subunit 1
LAALECFAKASNAIADSDIIDKKIHGASQEWSLAPMHGIFSCVLPAYYTGGYMGGRIEFAGWLGQNSKAGKNHRLLMELAIHMCLHISGGKQELRQSYLSFLILALTRPLIELGAGGVDQVISLLDAYTIGKEDYDAMMELGVGFCEGALLQSQIPTLVKSTLTRT